MTFPSNGQHRPMQQPPQPVRVPPTAVYILVMGVLLLGYLFFARAFERIDLSQSTTMWATFFPLIIRELFNWRVLRHLLPAIAGWYIAYRMAVGLVQVLYDLPDRPSARRFLTQLLYTTGTGNIPPVSLNSDLLYIKRDEYVVLRIGGPGRIKVRNGYVAVTELNGRYHRLLGIGTHRLERFEYVHDVLDLRLQERTQENVSLTSKDGIPFTATLSLQFRLSTSGETPTPTRPYPYDETAVRIAAYTQKVTDSGTVSNWDDAPMGMAIGQLTRIVSKHNIDEILTIPGGSNGSTPLLSIRNELTFKLRDGLQGKGIELIDVQISQIELPEEVSTQYIKYWQSHTDTQIQLTRVDGEANAMEEKELAQAEAEMTMIQAILEGVQRAQLANNHANMRDIVALRLVEALEKMARQSQQAAPTLPLSNVDEQLENIRGLLMPPPEDERDG